MDQVINLRKRHRFNNHMIRIVLLTSSLFPFGRLAYSAIDTWHHYQGKEESQQTTQSQQTSSA